ncbi:MAG: aldo/keto reductase [Bacteroidales bacterium]|nr:aldo/keto reductase [Bacteroidales bacterium]
MKDINRRDFLKLAGAGALAAGAAACGGGSKPAASSQVSGPDGEGQMEYRLNPKNGDKVSLLGYGCMRWQMKKDENGKDIVDQESVNELVDRALEAGINYFDTSPAYLRGQSEKASGNALARHPRSSYYIATKLSNFGDRSPEASEKMYHDSFEQMQTDYFDYYLMHSIGRGGYEAFKARYEDNGMMDFVLKEREAGRIRNLGFSFHGSKAEYDQMIALHDKYKWDFVQIEMNYMDWQHADGVRNVNADYLYESLDKRELPIVVMEPLLGGRLSSVPENVTRHMKEREPDLSIASWAFRFVGTYPRILTILSGMTYREHLEDNIKTFTGFKPLTEEELDFLKDMAGIMATYPTVNCTHCNYCMPCPYGIDIPEIFAHYNKHVNDGTVAQSSEQANYKKLRKDYLLSYNKAIPTLRQADHCIGCGQCMPHCPQSIEIPEQLHRIDRYIEQLKQNKL